MALKTSKSKTTSSRASSAPAPDLPLVALAVGGIVLTGYLSYTQWFGQPLAYCSEGSSCDLVQSSRWSTLFGLPIAVWGLAAYALLATLAASRAKLRSRALLMAGIVALSFSVYLNIAVRADLGVSCAYCLASLALLATAVAWLLMRLARENSRRLLDWSVQSLALAALVIIAAHLHYAGAFDPAAGPEDPELRALAEHLAATGAQFYGASWCPHCQEQKALFTGSAARLPYVECSPHGRNTPPATVCVELNIKNYPTWIINGRRYQNVLSIEQLKRASDFAGS
jgi:uncharacterized membrane protein